MLSHKKLDYLFKDLRELFQWVESNEDNSIIAYAGGSHNYQRNPKYLQENLLAKFCRDTCQIPIDVDRKYIYIQKNKRRYKYYKLPDWSCVLLKLLDTAAGERRREVTKETASAFLDGIVFLQQSNLLAAFGY